MHVSYGSHKDGLGRLVALCQCKFSPFLSPFFPQSLLDATLQALCIQVLCFILLQRGFGMKDRDFEQFLAR